MHRYLNSSANPSLLLRQVNCYSMQVFAFPSVLIESTLRQELLSDIILGDDAFYFFESDIFESLNRLHEHSPPIDQVICTKLLREVPLPHSLSTHRKASTPALTAHSAAPARSAPRENSVIILDLTRNDTTDYQIRQLENAGPAAGSERAAEYARLCEMIVPLLEQKLNDPRPWLCSFIVSSKKFGAVYGAVASRDHRRGLGAADLRLEKCADEQVLDLPAPMGPREVRFLLTDRPCVLSLRRALLSLPSGSISPDDHRRLQMLFPARATLGAAAAVEDIDCIAVHQALSARTLALLFWGFLVRTIQYARTVSPHAIVCNDMQILIL